MKRLANTLFVTTQDSYLAKEGETVVVLVESKPRLRVPIHNLEGIVCFGRVGASPALMGFCGQRGVSLSFLSQNGRFLARVTGPVSGNVLLRRRQYRLADMPEKRSALARSFVAGKLVNCRKVLLRAARDRPDNNGVRDLRQAAASLAGIGQRLAGGESLDGVRGMEGEAARQYFEVFDHLITGDKRHFFFRGRSRRPPLDNINALLSFLYVLLAHDVASALEGVGLDPAVGFLHSDRPGRPSLALGFDGGVKTHFGRPHCLIPGKPQTGACQGIHHHGRRRGAHGRCHQKGGIDGLSKTQTGNDQPRLFGGQIRPGPGAPRPSLAACTASAG